MVDVLHRINTVPVDVDLAGSARLQEVLGLHIPVLGAGQVITSRLLSMTEQYCDFGALLPAVRAVREQLDWAEIGELDRGQRLRRGVPVPGVPARPR